MRTQYGFRALLAGLIAAAALSFSAAVPAQQDSVVKLLDAVTATGAGTFQAPAPSLRTFQAVGKTSSGAGSATVKVQVTLDRDRTPIDLCTFTMTLSTTETTGGCVSQAPWRWVGGNVTAISGTGASVTLYMGR